MFLHRHGLVEERLEALSQNEIDKLANLLYLDWSKGKTALRLVKQLRKSCEQYTNGMPDSSDSPNTGEGFASASQTSQQDLFGFAKRRKSGAPNTSSEDEPDAEPQDDTPGGTWCREPSKEKESCGQDATLIKSGASFFFSSSSHDEDTEPDLDHGPRKRKRVLRKEPVTRKIGTSGTKQVTSRNKRNSETVDGQSGAGKIDTQQKAGRNQMKCSAQPARKATSKIFIDISDSEDSADPSKTIQRTEAGEQSSEDDGDVSDRGHDDFQKRTARFAATITKKCRCRLCRTHHSAGRLTAEQLIKGSKHYVPPFRKPATAAPTKALREWVAALFWCSHREERETWENLRIREREYMNSIPQFTTMVSGRSSQISSAGRGQSNFRAVPDGSTKLAYETIEHDEGSKVRSTPGKIITVEASRNTPPRRPALAVNKKFYGESSH